MDIRVSGHQVETGAALQTHVTDRLQGLTDRYFSRATAANVTFGKGPHDHGFTCDIVAPVVNGVVLKANGRAMSAQLAFEGAADKIERQLKRYKSRLRDRKGAEGMGGPGYDDSASYTIFAPPPTEEEPVAEHPPVIAETRVDIPTSSVSDAVMMLDLRNTNALMFKNSVTGAYNMVYRRDDGGIGWVEPRER
ncbi:ribosome hibernation-promoting factor, HPF/YfiA family [Sphingomonas glaciei]|uniref:Ribosome hibernation promoting factor n=1 Tax=Sphingomonas glaciei TaxID=2938948 RepID=A0ABY5MY59_9SPHN|nr:ribosome-associated translation inhibitor RaiA [Sphingomonas glaciei]UUR07291.1 ribosome-associated translation inhibitor RaiA [Sphingomonas glaciei]